jgi:NAD(P)-dependent dehydrogenase (short-subunit alcohol dehydrogenase family)
MSVAVNTVLPAGGVAFVTGGARGLGLAVALSFAREGCSGVTIVDVLSDDILAASKAEIEAAGVKCLALKCDVTKEDQIEQAVAATVKEFGRLDYAAYVNRTTSSRAQTDLIESAMRLV